MTSKALGLTAVATTAALLLSACSSGADTTAFSAPKKGALTARFVQQPWADLVVETQIASQVLDKLGYQTSTQEVSVPLAAQALATGKADAYLGNWWPSQQEVFTKSLDTGDVKVVGTLLKGTEFSPAVPGYVAKSLGVKSLADLDKNADAFGRKIYGIEPGAPANASIQKAIKEDAYGLGDWQLVASSTEAMLAEVSRRAAKKQPVVFLGWSPHWMVTEWDTVFLDDPKGVWPGAGQIRVMTRKGLSQTDPNLVKFLSQIAFNTKDASAFIAGVDKEKKSATELATSWIASNPEALRVWLNGVTSADGKPAADVVLAGSSQ